MRRLVALSVAALLAGMVAIAWCVISRVTALRHPAHGRLSSEERALLLAEQAKLFDASGRLRDAARPRWP